MRALRRPLIVALTAALLAVPAICSPAAGGEGDPVGRLFVITNGSVQASEDR